MNDIFLVTTLCTSKKLRYNNTCPTAPTCLLKLVRIRGCWIRVGQPELGFRVVGWGVEEKNGGPWRGEAAPQPRSGESAHGSVRIFCSVVVGFCSLFCSVFVDFCSLFLLGFFEILLTFFCAVSWKFCSLLYHFRHSTVKIPERHFVNRDLFSIFIAIKTRCHSEGACFSQPAGPSRTLGKTLTQILPCSLLSHISTDVRTFMNPFFSRPKIRWRLAPSRLPNRMSRT